MYTKEQLVFATSVEQIQRWAEYLDDTEVDKERELRRIKELERLLRQYKKELTK
jgi:hypothetical protein